MNKPTLGYNVYKGCPRRRQLNHKPSLAGEFAAQIVTSASTEFLEEFKSGLKQRRKEKPAETLLFVDIGK